MSPNIDRRQFIGMVTLGAAAAAIPGNILARSTPRHLVTLSFDDGFKKSSVLTASIFEKYKLSACINVVATGHLSNFVNPDEYQVTEKGDFGLWNELKARGHEIMPHGYRHANKTTMSLEKAQDLMRSCLDYFTEHLKDFSADEAVFNMPYNASNPPLEACFGEQVLAFRTGGPVINPMPYRGQKKLTCGAFGPGNTEAHLELQIKKLLELPEGWLIYNVHGLDGEGWGPMRSEYLDRLLDRLVAIDSVRVLPAGEALRATQ